MSARCLLVVVFSCTLCSCVTELPRAAACASSLELSATLPPTPVPVASLVMIGSDLGPSCSGTIVHLDDAYAYVLSARHCLANQAGVLRSPATQARVFLPRHGNEGAHWEARPVQRVIVPAGTATMTPWHDAELSDRDWAVLVVAREPAMRAVELADHLPAAGTSVSLVTVRSQGGQAQPCPHVRTFGWGKLTSLMVGGYSGAAIVSDGRVFATFTGGRTLGLWVFRHVTSLSFTPSSNVGRPWLPEVNVATPTL